MDAIYPVPAAMVPGCLIEEAIREEVDKNLLFCIGGGLGDQVCAIPSVRYALANYPECEISVLTPTPELFEQMSLKGLFKFSGQMLKGYLPLQTYRTPEHIAYQYFSPLLTHCVDYCSLTSLRRQLPLLDRVIYLSTDPNTVSPDLSDFKNPVILHAGKSWPSRTFPKEWWDSVASWLFHFGCTPIWIGQDNPVMGVGTVDINPIGIDLRGKLSINALIKLLQRATCLITNDSAPLHIAAGTDLSVENSGECWIGFISTVKPPDLLMHYRVNSAGRVKSGWRMKNFSRGGMWNVQNFAPNQANSLDVRNVDENLLRSWLPDTQSLAEWAAERREMKGSFEGDEA
jgi:hypothetical protein